MRSSESTTVGERFEYPVEADVNAINDDVRVGVTTVTGDKLFYDTLLLDNLTPNVRDVVTFYDCVDLLQVASRILWYDTVREALGYMPHDFRLSYQDIRFLCVLIEERGRKMQYDSWQMQRQTRQMQRQSQTVHQSGVGRVTRSKVSI